MTKNNLYAVEEIRYGKNPKRKIVDISGNISDANKSAKIYSEQNKKYDYEVVEKNYKNLYRKGSLVN